LALYFLVKCSEQQQQQSNPQQYNTTINRYVDYANRYVARSLSFDIVEIKDSFDNTKIFSDFIKLVNSQSTYNKDGKINAVPLITFHNVAWITNRPYYTNAELFDQLMKAFKLALVGEALQTFYG
jgi:hypothetical protein